nr:hypothetical protein [Kibdelosporangium sp. MJ126-NF4]CEL15621.1 hypothetical protein [Kibdelosporangium sp. MJ126-NF4]CTQ90340.1 hypothetical protein [Kibdelosporangium sp. MJ126-NF4]
MNEQPGSPGTFHVLIAPDSTAKLNRMPLPRKPEFIETTVLDELQQHALVHGRAVDAIVVDHRHDWVLSVRVQPNGQSSIVDGPRDVSTSEESETVDDGPLVRQAPRTPLTTQWGTGFPYDDETAQFPTVRAQTVEATW